MATDQDDLLRLGVRLKLDAAAGEVATALGARGVRAIVLKGSTLADRLYDDGTIRSHEDVDFLVRDAEVAVTEAVLRQLGFRRAEDDAHAQTWIRRRDGITVDIHTTFVGVAVAPERAWQALEGETQATRIGGVDVERLNDAGLALNIALHAAQHGTKAAKALEDLRRALSRFSADVWRRSALLAEQLDATPAFAAGLRLIPAGHTLAAELRLATEQPRDVVLRLGSPPPTSLGLQRLFTTSGVRERAALFARELAPPPTFMRAVYPIARRGPAGLAASYAWRPLWLLWHVGPAFRAWRRARRAAP